MAQGTILDTLDSMIREELPTLMMESLPEIDPVYSSIMRTSQDVVRDDVGRGWKVMHRFRTSLSGMIQPVGTSGGATSGLYNTAQTQFYGTLSAFPNPADTPHTGNVVRGITLNAHHGNFGVPLFLLKPEALSSAVMKQVADDLQGLAKLRAHLEAISFYISSTKHLGTLPIDGATGGPDFADGSTAGWEAQYTANTAAMFTPGESRIRWWKPGMLVDVFDAAAASANIVNSTDGTDANRVVLVVDMVDYVNGTVILASKAGVTLHDTGGLHANDGQELGKAEQYVYPFGGIDDTAGVLYTTGHYGLEDWIKASGTLFGNATAWNKTGNDGTAAFDLSVYPQFKSSVTSSLALPLTEKVLNEKIGAFIDAYGSDLDTIITTRKVIQKYLEQPTVDASRLVWDRTNKALQLKGGWADVGYEYEGRTLAIKISPYCQAQTLYAIKMGGNNCKRYVPPASIGVGGIPGPGTGLGMDSEIEFIAPMGGSSSIFKLVHSSSGAVQPLVEAPFQQYSQVAPVDVRGIKIGGITESN